MSRYVRCDVTVENEGRKEEVDDGFYAAGITPELDGILPAKSSRGHETMLERCNVGIATPFITRSVLLGCVLNVISALFSTLVL